MRISQTLPRPRLDPPTIPPHRQSGTLTRNGNMGDVERLRMDIDTLTRQLNMVRAQLDSQLDKSDRESLDSSVDSRLSTALFSPIRTRDNTPTPQPTNLSYNTHTPLSFYSTRPDSLRKENMSQSMSQLSRNLGVRRFGTCIPSTSTAEDNRLFERGFATFEQQSTSFNNGPATRVRRADSLHDIAPPKPARSFLESLDRTLQRRVAAGGHTSTSIFFQSPIADIPDGENDALVQKVSQAFTERKCWFTIRNELYFVNPFNDISCSSQSTYSAIPQISTMLLKNKDASLILRGVAGSGKTQICEQVLLDLSQQLNITDRGLIVLRSAITVLRPLFSVNTSSNNMSSKAVHYYELSYRDSLLTRLTLRHFLLESPSRGCKATVFAMLANDMREQEKVRFRISGFQLRENISNYGSLPEFRQSINALGLSADDVVTALCACMLLNNLAFKMIKGFVDVDNLSDLEDSSFLLGISSLSLYRTLMNGTLNDVTIEECEKIRDSLVAAIYSRVVQMIINKANRELDSGNDVEGDSGFDDSGLGTSCGDQNSVYLVDIPGYIKSKNNRLTELLINTINDTMDGRNREMSSRLLENIEMLGGTSEQNISKRLCLAVSHCEGLFSVDYDATKMATRNTNEMSRELITLFDSRSCSRLFIVKLFASDIISVKEDIDFQPCAVPWGYKATVIESVMDLAKQLQNRIADCDQQFINCIKSNDRLEFSRISEKPVRDQLDMLAVRPPSPLRQMLKRSPHSVSPFTTTAVLPAPRSYEVRDGRKYIFPQRRNVIVDFVDQMTGVTLHAGEVVKAVGFSGECFVVENSRRTRIAVPISFTEKSLPPSEAFSV